MKWNRSARTQLVLAAVLALTSFAPFSERANADTYCPLFLAGQWNGVYYYYSHNCVTGALCFATSSQAKTAGTPCPCGDPIVYVVRSMGVGKQPTPKVLDPTPKLLGFVHPWDPKKKPGEAEMPNDPNGTFFPPADTRFVPTKEEVLWVTDEKNNKKPRYFRALTVEPNPNCFPPNQMPAILRIGQELKVAPKAPEAQEATIDAFDTGSEMLHHRLKKKAPPNEIFYVISKDKLEKP